MFQTRERADNYRDRGIAFLVLALLLFLLGLGSSFVPLFLIAVLLLIVSFYFFENYQTWSIGAEGEEKVAEYLYLLNDSYYVIHDVVLPGMIGNIDHIVLGPNGVFVIETKNHRGLITCNGDHWTQRKIGRRGTPYLGNIGSPSKQVKKKAVLLNRFIQSHFNVNLYVNGIVVFTNEEADLVLNNPTVIILRPDEICDSIRNYRSKLLKDINLKELKALIEPYSNFS